jgi:hypothetical protein
MSCAKCENLQRSDMTSYYRWKNADIEIRACREHLIEVFEALNAAQAQARERQTSP